MKAVQILLASRAGLNSEKSSSIDVKADSNAVETESQKSDRIQVSFLPKNIWFPAHGMLCDISLIFFFSLTTVSLSII